MHEADVYKAIASNPKFVALVHKRGRLAWLLSAIILAAFLAYIYLIAYRPELLGTPLSADTTTTWGMPVGVGLIFLSIALTGVYVRRANGEFERLNQEILAEAQR